MTALNARRSSLLAALGRHPVWAQLDADALARLAKLWHSEHLPAGAPLADGAGLTARLGWLRGLPSARRG